MKEAHDLQGNEASFDKAKATFRPAIYGILIRDDRLLCVQPRWDDKLALPGGAIELGENFDEALKRELLEETGHKIELCYGEPFKINTLLYADTKKKINTQRIDFYFEIKSNGIDDTVDIDEEIEDLMWIPIEKITEEDFTFYQKEVIKKIKEVY